MAAPVYAFYRRTAEGVLTCQVCEGRDGRHAPTCALVALRVQVQELGGQLGLYVATMRELLDVVDRLLCGSDQVSS